MGEGVDRNGKVDWCEEVSRPSCNVVKFAKSEKSIPQLFSRSLSQLFHRRIETSSLLIGSFSYRDASRPSSGK